MNGLPASEYVAGQELVARFVMSRERIRADGTVRPAEFVPYPHSELSVTRHRGLEPGAIWQRGRSVASARGKPLLGRADLGVSAIRGVSLAQMDVVAAQLPSDPEHANIVGWPPEKSSQLMIAQLIAASASFVRAPESP